VKILSRTGPGEKIMKYVKFLEAASAALMLVITTLVLALGAREPRDCWMETESMDKQPSPSP
jgi:hypothetical protein